MAEPEAAQYDYTIVEPVSPVQAGQSGPSAVPIGQGQAGVTDALLRTVRGFERAFGRTVIFVRPEGQSPGGFNGFILPKSDPNAIYVNPGADVSLAAIFGHEFYECLAVQSPRLHAWFV